MLDRMEAANLIYRDRGDKDRRKILIFLTEEAKGKEAPAEFPADWHERFGGMAAGVAG